jgi:hypothetical protein
MHRILALFLSVILSSCSTTTRPYVTALAKTSPPAEVATISGYIPAENFFNPTRFHPDSLTVMCIDGTSLSSYFKSYGKGSRYPETVVVTPGWHRIGVRYDTSSGYVTDYVDLNAAAGKTYKLRGAQLSGRRGAVWIEDADSGKRLDFDGAAGNAPALEGCP